jgi:DNA-binding NarL/FixJ family response regulator
MSTVLLLHGDLRVAHRLRQLIDSAPGLEAVGVATHLAQARECLSRNTPDLLLADLLLPDGNITSLLDKLRGNGRCGRPQLLVLAMSVDDPRLMDALRHGADGYFIPGSSPAPLFTAIEQVLHGESTMSPQIARELMSHFDSTAWDQTDFIGEAQNPLRLSETERLLLQWTAEGYLVSEVARTLQISLHGVGVRMRNIYRKMQFDLRADALSLMAAA